jgi:hypothetical protein
MFGANPVLVPALFLLKSFWQQVKLSLSLSVATLSTSRSKIWVLSDSKLVLDQFELFRQRGYPIVAYRADSALSHVLSSAAIVFLDPQTSGQSSSEIIRLLQHRSDWFSIPLIVLTSEVRLCQSWRQSQHRHRFLLSPKAHSDGPEFKADVEKILREFSVKPSPR